MNTHQLGHWNYIEPTLDSCIKLARDCSKGTQISDVSAGLMLHPSFCNILLASVESVLRKHVVKIEQTGSTYSPLVSEQATRYSTPKVNDGYEFNDMLRIANKLIELNKQNALDDSLTRPFLQSSRSHSYVIYSDIAELLRTVEFYKTIVGVKRFYVVIEPLFNDVVSTKSKQIIKLLGKDNVHEAGTRAHQRELFPDGRYKLHVKHVNSSQVMANRELDSGVNKYSTNTLKVALFWTEVFCDSMKLWSDHVDRIRQPDLFN